jgi:DNA mismatch repair protein MutS2
MPLVSERSLTDPPEDPFFLAEYGDTPTIDLHGYDISGALFEIDHFIGRFVGKEAIVIKLIHGHGEGRLRTAIHAWLTRHRYVDSFRDAERFDQSGAVTYVLLSALQRKEKNRS